MDMKQILLLFFLLTLSTASKAASIEDLKSAHLLKNKYGSECLKVRKQLIDKLNESPIEKVEEIIWFVQNEILQEGIMRARDMDLRDLIVVWIKKYGIQKVRSNPESVFQMLGAQDRYIHSYRMALEVIEGRTVHPEMTKIAEILKS
jgi:hypothetical protein